MSCPSEQHAITYAEAVRVLNTEDVQADINDACGQLALFIIELTKKIDTIAELLRTTDSECLPTPFGPRWSTLHNDLRELLWHFKYNASFISGRLKMFCNVVLPLVARTSSEARSHDEKLQVLRSYMTISADHAALTKTLVANTMNFNNALKLFHIDYLEFTGQRTASCQRELRDLSKKLDELETTTRQLCAVNGQTSGLDVTHFVYSTLRLNASCQRKSGRARLSYQRLALFGDLAVIGRLDEQLEGDRNKVAHAQYTAEICHHKTDALTTAQTTISTLVSDEMIVMEVSLSFFLSIWARLQYDCNDILHWLQHPQNHSEMPHSIASLLDGGCTLYASVANGLDALVPCLGQNFFFKNSDQHG